MAPTAVIPVGKEPIIPPNMDVPLSSDTAAEASIQQSVTWIKSEPMDAYNTGRMMDSSDIGPPNIEGRFQKIVQGIPESIVPNIRIKKEIMSPTEVLKKSVQVELRKLPDVDKWGKFQEFDLDHMTDLVRRNDSSKNRNKNDNYRVYQSDINDIEALVTCINRKPSTSNHQQKHGDVTNKGSNSIDTIGGSITDGSLPRMHSNEDSLWMKKLDIKECCVVLELNKDGSPRKHIQPKSPSSMNIGTESVTGKGDDSYTGSDQSKGGEPVISPDAAEISSSLKRPSKTKVGPKCKTRKVFTDTSSSSDIPTSEADFNVLSTNMQSQDTSEVCSRSNSQNGQSHSRFNIDLKTKTLKLNLVRIDDTKQSQDGKQTSCLNKKIADSGNKNENIIETIQGNQTEELDNKVDQSDDVHKSTELSQKVSSALRHQNYEKSPSVQGHDIMDNYNSAQGTKLVYDFDADATSKGHSKEKYESAKSKEERKRPSDSSYDQPLKKVKLDNKHLNFNSEMNKKVATVELLKIDTERMPKVSNHDITKPKIAESNAKKLSEQQPRTSGGTKTVGFTCKICRLQFDLLFMLKKHLREYHKLNTDHEEFKCQICSKHFIDNQLLTEHMTTHKEHTEQRKGDQEKEGKSKLTESIDKPIADTGSKKISNKHSDSQKNIKSMYRCVSCQKTFDSNIDYFDHLKSHQKNKCEVCSEVFNDEKSVARHMKKHRDTQCDICDKYFISRKELESHVMIHKQTEDTTVNHSTVNKVKSSDSSTGSIKLKKYSSKQDTKKGQHGEKQGEKRRSNENKHDKSEKLRRASTSPVNQLDKEVLPQTVLFPCMKCPDVFTSKEKCEEHMKTHTSLNTSSNLLERAIFPCTKCSGLFLKKEDLVKHLKVHDDTEYKCEVCDKVFASTKDLEEHQEIHKAPPSTKCDVCFLTFQTVDELHTHMKSHKNEKHKCDLCFKSFGKKTDLIEHQKASHNIIYRQCDKCQKDFTSATEYENHVQNNCQSVYKCEICSEILTSKMAFDAHVKLHETLNTFSCEVCSSKFKTAKDLQKHSRTHDAESCPICFKIFSSETVLNEHMNVHYGKNSQQCKKCVKYFPSDTEYQKHVKDFHTDELKCAACQMSFRASIDLNNHMCAKKNEPFKCIKCDQSFSTESLLSVHVKEDHMDGMGYMCGQCVIPFRTEKDLTKHVEECHDKVEYKCGICEKRFLSEKKLMDHIIVHQAQFQCGICQQSFNQEDQLLEHINTHASPAGHHQANKLLNNTHASPSEHPCENCGLKFTDKQALKQHSENCTSVSEYQCSHCKCYFSRQDILVQHVLSHKSSPAFTCSFCGEVFKSKEEHDKHKHSSKQPRVFKCGLCPYIGLTRNMLMRHLGGHL